MRLTILKLDFKFYMAKVRLNYELWIISGNMLKNTNSGTIYHLQGTIYRLMRSTLMRSTLMCWEVDALRGWCVERLMRWEVYSLRRWKGQLATSDELQATSCHAAQVEWHTDDADETVDGKLRYGWNATELRWEVEGLRRWKVYSFDIDTLFVERLKHLYVECRAFFQEYQGVTFLPNREAQNRLIHQFGCKEFQSGKNGKCKDFQ